MSSISRLTLSLCLSAPHVPLSTCAPAQVTHPLCVIEWLLGRWHGLKAHKIAQGEEEDRARPLEHSKSFFLMLSDATWLPPPYRQLEHFQGYLITLWGPALVSNTIYWLNLDQMKSVSPVEPLCPLLLYFLIGLIVATISGFEHRGLVMRRKYILTGESRQEDLRAIFAFVAHTPEGHAVERIGQIADVLCGAWFQVILFCVNVYDCD